VTGVGGTVAGMWDLVFGLRASLGRQGFALAVLIVLAVVLLVVAALRRRGARTAAGWVAFGGLGVAIAGVLSLTLTGPLPTEVAEPTLILDPVLGAWGWSSIAWRPVVDNVALFVPVGALAIAAFWRRSSLLVWLGCVALSVGVEAFQYLVPTGRVANAADVLANAIGALFGIALAVVLRVRVAGPRRGVTPVTRERVPG
jgi:hypothetical protein